MKQQVVIIGAGAAGCFAAINAARRFPNTRFLLLEATQKPLAKVLISGGGRCNVTHNQFEPKLLAKNYPRGNKELIGSMHQFGPKDVQQWFANEGVELTTEPDGRMFPVSNTSRTIADCLLTALDRAGVQLRKGVRVATAASKPEGGFDLTLASGELIQAHKILLATGSSPVGYELARKLGHTIEDLVPSLFTFKIADPFLKDLAGQSIAHACLELSFSTKASSPAEKKNWRQQGPLLITHWGLSGPAVLKLSAFAARALHQAKYKAELKISWVGGKNTEETFDEIWHYRESHSIKKIGTQPLFGLSRRLWQRFLGDDADLNWADLTKKRARSLASDLCQQKLAITGKGIFKEEFVTCGGVKRSEIDFSRMESKIIPNLFFSGEVTDVDGITGGFNFQNAWTGSWIASHFLGKN